MGYRLMAEKTENLEKKENYLKKCDQILTKFNKNYNDIEFERKLLDEATQAGKNVEKNFCELIKQNCLHPNTRMSFVAVILYNAFIPFAGGVYSSSYTTPIFDKLVGEGFG